MISNLHSPRAVTIHAVPPHHHRLEEFILQRTLQRGLRCRLDRRAALSPKVKERVAWLRVRGLGFRASGFKAYDLVKIKMCGKSTEDVPIRNNVNRLDHPMISSLGRRDQGFRNVVT